MRKVIAEIAVSLDGFIEGSDGGLEWLVFDEQPSYVHDFLSRFEVVFFGRVAYEKVGVYLLSSSESSGYNATFSQLRKYVFSRTVKHVSGNGMVVNSDICEHVARIKAEEGKDIWLSGGGEIISLFASMNLIDEYILAVQPVILGAGKPLFCGVLQRIHLQLLNAEQLSSGVVILNYRPYYTTSS